MELNQREKLMLALALGILVPVLLLRFVFFPFFDYKNSLGRKISRLQTEIVTIEQLGGELQRSSRKSKSRGRVGQRVEAILTRIGIRKGAVIANRAQEKGEGVTVKLDLLTLAQTTEFFFLVENTPPLSVYAATVSHSVKDEKKLTLDMIITNGVN